MSNKFRSLSFMCALFLVAAGFLETSWAQERRKEPYLEGVVRDFVTGSIISGASVLIEETGQRLTSNDKGYFQVEGLKPGGYTIHLSHPQHRSLLFKNFQLRKGGVYAGFALKSGSPSDQPYVSDGTPREQFVIDEDAELIERREPKYPESALKEKAEGTILLWVGVDEKGEVGSAMFKEGSKREDLLEASREAVQYFKFKPAKVKGKPVGVMVTVPFNFKLADKTTKFPLKQEKGTLTPGDISDALGFLGVKIEKFSYSVPFRHKMISTVDEYVDGKLRRTTPSGMLETTGGKRTIKVFSYTRGDSLEITISNGTDGMQASSSFGKVSLWGCKTSGSTSFENTELQSGKKIPFCAVAFDPNHVGLSSSYSIPDIVSRHKCVFVISVELRLDN
jgi:TonB family protein